MSRPSEKVIFVGEEQIRSELARLEDEEPDEEIDDLDEVDSETDENILPNEDQEVDEFFDDENDEAVLPWEPSSVLDAGDRDFILSKDNESIWTTSTLVSRTSKIPKKNIVIFLPGAKGAARNCDTPCSFFELFLSDDIVQTIVRHTNEEITTRPLHGEWYSGHTDGTEIKALIGFLILSGASKNSDVNINDHYSLKFGLPFFRCVMSRNRFKFLLSRLRFDSKQTRKERVNTDKFAPFRDVWEMFIANCENHYIPSEYLTIDETLFSFRGRCPFKMYIPSKPDKYGLKVVSICDARTFYFCGGIPYVGKNTIERVRSLLLPTCYVLLLCDKLKNTNRNITADNWFSSCELADELMTRKLTYVGTMRKNKREIPPELVAVKGIKPMTSRFVYQPDKMLVSFSEKKNKNVILLSTMHDEGTIHSDSGKPDIIEFYNFTKGGVHCMDKMCHTYTTKRFSRRWPMRYFYGMLDIMGINAFILLSLAGIKSNRVAFLRSVAFDLAVPHMKRRAANPRISKTLRTEIQQLLGEERAAVPPTYDESVPSKMMRCYMCERKKDRKTNNHCNTCKRPICKEHGRTIQTCLICHGNESEGNMDTED